MKISFSLNDKKATIDADVEKLVEKGIDLKAQNPNAKTRYQIKQEEKRKTEELKQKTPRKTRYQIKQEEKRKNEALKQKHFIQGMIILVIVVVFGLAISGIGSFLGI